MSTLFKKKDPHKKTSG